MWRGRESILVLLNMGTFLALRSRLRKEGVDKRLGNRSQEMVVV